MVVRRQRVKTGVVSCADPLGNLSWILFQEKRISELMLRRGVGQAAHTPNNPHVDRTGVLLCVIREYLQLQLNCVDDISSAGFFITVNTH